MEINSQQPKKYFSFRFDVDTPLCIAKGVPNLIDLASHYNVHFTFFVNMGKAISRFHSTLKAIKGVMHPQNNRGKLSPVRKLGIVEYLKVLFLNPNVGLSYPNIIRRASETGHEIGLHGGLNHGRWQADGASWSEPKLRFEVSMALNSLENVLTFKPGGFSSPGWQNSDILFSVLETLNFQYTADIHDPEALEVEKHGPGSNLISVPTNIVGEPSGIGYIENLRARNFGDSGILENFKEQLINKRIAVAYDHPCYAATKELKVVGKMIETALSMGFSVSTMSTIVKETYRDLK